MTYIRKCLQYRAYIIRATFLNLVVKGHPTWLHRIDDRETVKITGSKGPFRPFVQVLKKAFFLLWIRIKSPYQWYKSSLSKILFYPSIHICEPNTNFWLIHRPIAQTPQCPKPISHNAPFCDRNMLENRALWVICLKHYGIGEMEELFMILIFSDFYPRPFTKSNICS